MAEHVQFLAYATGSVAVMLLTAQGTCTFIGVGGGSESTEWATNDAPAFQAELPIL